MSWLFGIKNQQAPPPQTGGDEDPNQPPQKPLTTSERKAMEAYRFDSSALERAAEAAKVLERSSNFRSKFINNFFFHVMKLTRKLLKFCYRTCS